MYDNNMTYTAYNPIYTAYLRWQTSLIIAAWIANQEQLGP